MAWTGAWPSQDIANLERSIRDVAQLVQHPAPDQSDDVTRALVRFLVVRTCGYLEQVVEQCCIALLRSKAAPRVSSYGESWLGRGANPTPGNLVALVRRFDLGWSDELNDLFTENDEMLKREVGLLVDRRNKIAHGLGEGMRARKALELLDSAEVVATWFITTFDPRH